MAETKTYSGGCHCGKVRFDAKMELDHVAACNCSICSKQGCLLAFVAAERFTLRSGEDALSEYRFHKEHIRHRFCSSCGISSFSSGKGADGKEMFSINVRCLDGVDATTLPVKHFDGKSL